VVSSSRTTPNPLEKESFYRHGIRQYEGQYRDFHCSSVEVLLHLILTGEEVQSHFAGRLAAYRLSVSAFNILMILNRKPEKRCFFHELSDLLLVSRANVTGLVDTLVKQGRVERLTDPEDRRKFRVCLTSEGASLLRKILPHHFKEVRRIVSVWNPKEKKTFNELLEQLRRNLKARPR
jgi:MarR family 2-MHQ and catechol resistance regulon transcriptional repressor